ncbi:facilitated trehalose transporter Tret1-like [Pogonomyrmex barbatus]|uniref:Facilitated trehalose transporter Tret1-like n=1 Tax=Pogonomyrmex barbatus TaxID=144034 RepID=A0A6I9W509_9HYME|nr:facilitated trehalose transporter Tret1-like [Pogonomyrmex barbatus]
MKKIYLAAVAGNLGMLSTGQYIGWASPSLPLLIMKDNDDPKSSVSLTLEEASWVISLLTLGGITGCVSCIFMVNIFGRKKTMLFTIVPTIISWLLIAFATSAWELYVSRFVGGLSLGIAYSATPMYLGEISPADIRGKLSSMLTVAVKLGILIEFVIGPFLSMRNLAFVSLVAPCLFVIAFIWLPESPYYLMRCDAKQKAINCLVQLRGKEDVDKEADNIEQFVKTDLANKANFRELIFVPGNRRALITLMCLGIFQQSSGSQAVMQYAETIFNQINSNLEGKYLTIILGVVQLIFAIISMTITDRYGRKPLLIISSIGSACSTAMIATYFHLQYYRVDTNNITWLPAIGAVTYIVMYAIGLAGIPFTLASELFPMNVKAIGTTTTILITNVTAFIVTKLYPSLSEMTGTHTSFWLFTACSIISALFTFFYIFETKGKTLEQIQQKLHSLSK